MNKDYLRNRANDDREFVACKLRIVNFLKDPKAKPCRDAGGHEHIFKRGDRYGCCVRCGDEVLT